MRDILSANAGLTRDHVEPMQLPRFHPRLPHLPYRSPTPRLLKPEHNSNVSALECNGRYVGPYQDFVLNDNASHAYGTVATSFVTEPQGHIGQNSMHIYC